MKQTMKMIERISGEGMDGLKAKLVTLTPGMAEQWLESFDKNRNVRVKFVDRMAQDIRDGRWRVNGQPIVISKEGQLLDGQHRCMAVIGANKPIKVLVIEGVETEAFSTLDSGVARNTADILHFMGYEYTSALAAAATKIWSFRNGEPGWAGGKAKTPSRQQVIQTVKGCKGLEEIVHGVCTHVPRRIISPSVLSSLLWLFKQKDAALSNELFEVMSQGKVLPQPFHFLREKLLALRIDKTQRTMASKTVVGYTIKAWNAARERRKVEILRMTLEEDIPEIE